MNLLLATFGTAGDVQPILALALGLRSAGHHVRMCAPKGFAPLIQANGIPFWPFAADLRELFGRSSSMMGHPIRGMRQGLAVLAESWADHFDVVDAASEGAEAIIGAGLCISGSSVAEKLKVPYWHVAHMPGVLESARHPPYNSPWQGLPRFANRLLWLAHRWGQRAMTARITDAWRDRHGLPKLRDPWSHLFRRAVIAIDPELATVPPDVTAEHVQTGYWQWGPVAPLPARVEAFLAAGDEPVYLGFGSMGDGEAARTVQAVAGALEKTGRRAVVMKGWSSAIHTELGDRVLVMDAADHRALFPRVAAVVHHGGAGTVRTAAAAGAPQIIVPHTADQFFWGHRIAGLGLGPKPLRKARLTADRLAAAIEQACGDPGIAAATARMRDAIAPRDGLADFLARFDALMASPRR